jgi:hypothetical protein
LAADVSPATTVGDVAKLLHIDVDEIAGFLVLVTADHLSRPNVDVVEFVQSAADQHGVDGRGRHPEFRADSDRSEAFLPPQMHDLPHQILRGFVRAVVRARRG